MIDNFKTCGIKKISIVTGFNRKKLEKSLKSKNVNFIYNKNFNKTEMTYSLKLALNAINSDLLIVYSDIIFEKKLINKLIKNKFKDIVLPVLKNWKKIWKIRNKNIYDDAETLIVKRGKVIEIGNKLKRHQITNGQYMGIILIRKNVREKILKILNNKKFQKKHITFFLNYLIRRNFTIKPLFFRGKWYEFDDMEDLLNFKRYFK